MDDGLDEGRVEEESDITILPLPNPKPNPTTPIIEGYIYYLLHSYK